MHACLYLSLDGQTIKLSLNAELPFIIFDDRVAAFYPFSEFRSVVCRVCSSTENSVEVAIFKMARNAAILKVSTTI